MASNSNTGEVELVLLAFINILVDPLLPTRLFNATPSQDTQISVAKQMHAVVLLFNYYHRKQKPDLAFLDFTSFCKLVVMIKPPLTSFINLLMENESKPLHCAEEQLSVTERAIKNACKIAVSLDASLDSPDIKGWPISKVAVLLIDSKRETCMLNFGSITQGVWSTIEKEIDDPNMTLENSSQRKRKSSDQTSMDYDELLQLAYDAVKDATGYASSDLEVLRSHVTYSLSKEKSATLVYMMQYRGSFSINNQVPLDMLVESLQGPLVRKLDSDSWETTSVVEYHDMLPYLEFVACFLSGKDSSPSSLNGCNTQSTRYRTRASSALENELNKLHSTDSKISGMEVASCRNKKKRGRPSLSSELRSPVNIVLSSGDGKVADGSDKKHDVPDSPKNSLRITAENALNDSSRAPSQKMLTYEDTLGTKYVAMDSADGEHTSKEKNSMIRVYHHRRKNNSSAQDNAHVQDDGVCLKVDDAAVCNQDVSAEIGRQTILFDSNNENGVNVESKSGQASEDLQNALALLQRKRIELHSQICNLEDSLALYEDNIARIRDGDEVGLARQCIKAIICGDDKKMVHDYEQEDQANDDDNSKLSHVYLPGKSSCQDLEYVCTKNNWRLPRYFTKPVYGKFVASVVVEGKDFELCSKGSLELEPKRARESAAAHIIPKIQDSFSF